jgi:hypothetical protein
MILKLFIRNYLIKSKDNVLQTRLLASKVIIFQFIGGVYSISVIL